MFEQAVRYMEENGPERRSQPSTIARATSSARISTFSRSTTRGYPRSGAAPETLVGLKVLDTTDAAGNPLFREMIDATGLTRQAQLARLRVAEPRDQQGRAQGELRAQGRTVRGRRRLLGPACDGRRRARDARARGRIRPCRGCCEGCSALQRSSWRVRQGRSLCVHGEHGYRALRGDGDEPRLVGHRCRGPAGRRGQCARRRDDRQAAEGRRAER